MKSMKPQIMGNLMKNANPQMADLLFKSTPQFATMEDMERYFYGGMLSYDLAKTTIGTGTSGAFNPIFGPKLWYQTLMGRKIFASLAKKPYEKSGYRAIGVNAFTSTVGLSAQGASIPTAVVPTFKEINVGLKEVAGCFEQSAVANVTEGKDDIPTWTELRTGMSKDFEKELNAGLVGDMNTAAASWYEFETLDRIIASTAEVTNDTGITAGDEDVYGIDRSAASTVYDAYVSSGSSGNPPTTRTLTLNLIDQLEENTRPYWDDTASTDAVYYTGFDTLYAWSRLLQPNQRFDTDRFVASYNGIEGAGGNKAGFVTQTYNGIPIIPNNDIVARGTGGTPLRNIMLVGPDAIHLAVAKPMLYLESMDFLAIGKFVRQAAFYMIGETTCTNFKACGKLRDIAK